VQKRGEVLKMPFMKEEMKKKDEAILADMEKEIKHSDEVEETTNEVNDSKEEDSNAVDTAAIQAELDKKTQELQESEDRLMRLRADFDNFRRRTRQEKEELSAVVLQGILADLLPLLDNFERALAVETSAEEAFKEGMSMVYNQFVASLQKNGLEPIKAVGEKFDPNFHQAVMRVEDAGQEDDTIIEELQKGYMAHGRVIRPSMVKVVAN
jgi:molecular chaperone GrpE